MSNYKKFMVGIDLQGNDIKRFALENLSTTPQEYLSTGRVWFDTETKQIKVYSGADEGVIVVGGSELGVTQGTVAAKAGQLIVSADENRGIKVYDTAGVLKINANGEVVVAEAGVDYLTASSESVLTNKTIVLDDGVNETGNSLSGLTVSNFAASALASNLATAGQNQLATANVIKAYIDETASSLGALVGAHDASEGLLPTAGTAADGSILAGNYWRISAEGLVNGLGKLEVGDVLVASANYASTAADFFVLEGNLTDAVTSATDGDVAGQLARFTDSSGKVIESAGIVVEADGSLDLPEGAEYKIAGENILTNVAAMFSKAFDDDSAWSGSGDGTEAPYFMLIAQNEHGLDASKSLAVCVRDDIGDEVYVATRIYETGEVEIMSNLKFAGSVLITGLKDFEADSGSEGGEVDP